MKHAFFPILFLTLSSAVTTVSAQDAMDLNACMAYAVEHNYDAARATTDADNSQKEYTRAILSHLPSLSASVGGNMNFGRGIDPATNSYISTSTFNNGWGANLGLPLFNGLQMINQTRSARIGKLRGDENIRQTADRIAEKTMGAYAETVYNAELVTLYRERVERYQMEEKLNERKCELGLGAEADLAQIRATLATEEYNLIAAMKNYDLSIIKLKDCMNFPLRDSLNIEAKISETAVFRPDQTDDEIYEYAVSYDPRASIEKFKLEQSRLSLATTRGAYYPSLHFSAGISTSYFTRMDGVASSSGTVSYLEQLKNNIGEGMSVSLSIPIFNGLDRRINVGKARNNYSQAKRDHQQAFRTLASDIQQATMELRALESQWRQAVKNVESQTLANRANRAKYEQGLLDIVTLQTSDNALMLSQIELRNTYLRYQIKIREVNYYKGIPYIE